MAREIIIGTYRDYVFLFGDSRTAYSDWAAKIAGDKKLLYIMLEDNFPAGYLCANGAGTHCDVIWAYTDAGKRRRGVFTALLKNLTQLENFSEVEVKISERQDNLEVVAGICRALGFVEQDVLKTFRADWESLRTWKENYFDKFMAEHGHKYLEYFSRRNFEVYTFREAPPEYLEQLYNSRENFFGNVLNVKDFFDGYKKNFVERDLSLILVKDGRLAAYYLVTSPDGKSLVVEQTVVARKYLNSGAILPLWNRFICDTYVKTCDNLVFAVYADNSPALKFDSKITRNLQLTASSTYCYRFLRNY